jgi:uncharacterized protein with von Willebrand factor type A (vWA) domain
MSQLLANVTHFVRMLRRLGLPVTVDDTTTFVAALDRTGLADRATVKSAGRAVLARRREHQTLFDRAFDAWWQVNPAGARLPPAMGAIAARAQRRAELIAHRPGHGTPQAHEDDARTWPAGAQQTWSERERLRHRDFAELSEDELRSLSDLMEALRFQTPRRRTRRTSADWRGPRPDLRRTLRRSLRHGGEPIRLMRRERITQPRPLVVLCDISGSMSAYSRVLLQFLYAVARTGARVEAFAFATRLTRLTRQLRQRSVNDALRGATSAIMDWGGGTRIGEALRAFNWHWSRRVLRGGAVVLLISDGWDRGSPELLRTEIMRLRRSCHRLMWLNPLGALPGYEPLTAGLKAALPHVDDFLPFHNLVSLEQLAGILASGEHVREGTAPGARRPRAARPFVPVAPASRQPE